MSVPYRNITRSVALKINAIVGTTTAQLESAYTTTPLTSTQVGSPIFPFSSIVDLVLQAEGHFVNVIANSEHAYRSYLRGITSAISSETAMPIITVLSQPIVGIPGAIYDSTDGTPCVWRPLQEILVWSRNSGTWHKCDVYWWNINAETVYHTRSAVVAEVCTYNEATQRTAIGANGNILLPDDMEGAYIDEALRQAFRDDEFSSQASQFGTIADQWIDTIRNAKKSAAA